ncbi:MAG: putative lipid II flippase FtsW [Oscillospiraceae bacterium]|nr:putative lipid II flippase FtsW [Oscillospiraceae bacterium]
MSNASEAAAGGKKIRMNRNRSDRKKEMTSEGVSKGYTEKIVSGPMDLPFFLIIMVLLVMGIIMMFSAGYAWAIAEGHEGTYYVKRQIGMAVVGLAGMFVVSFLDYHFYRKPVIVFGLFAVAAVLLVLCRVGPFTDPHNNSYRWIKIGSLPSFQPSEIMKLAIILLFSYLISINYSKLKQFKYGIVPFAAFLAVVVGLMAIQPHFSGTIIICAIGIIMMFVGGSNVKHLVVLGLIGVAAIVLIMVLLIEFKGVTYIQTRLLSWLDPFNEEASRDKTWQTRNSLIAIGSGGMFGLGLGNSRQKFLYLPESKNDFVFAVVCEELGFVGALMVIILFLLFIIRGFFIAAKAPDKFGMMLVLGLTVQIGLQALLNIAVVTNTIPNTGVSLPFFSYGGTALIMQLVQMGIILNVSRKSLIKT